MTDKNGDDRLLEMQLRRIVIRENSDQQYIYLVEKGGERSFPIVIGTSEAFEIRRVVCGVQTERPLTHQLAHDLIESLVEIAKPAGNGKLPPGRLEMNRPVGDHRELPARGRIDDPVAGDAGSRVKTKNSNAIGHQRLLSCESSSLPGVIVTALCVPA